MDFIQPRDWSEALEAKSAQPDAVPIMGGTDLMVEINFDQQRPPALLDLTRITESTKWSLEGGQVRLGMGVTYTQVIEELSEWLPGLAIAARTVGSPQIRHRGTVSGNLGSASPAGDSHPPLLATDTSVEAASVRGTGQIPIADFYTGVKQHALASDELITAVLTTPANGPQQFCKIGPRNAMVISVAAFALALHPDRRTVGTGIGSGAPTPRPANDAEKFLARALDEDSFWENGRELPFSLVREFGRRVENAAAPIDDVRGSAAYRVHSLGVMARRALTWAWNDYRKAG